MHRQGICYNASMNAATENTSAPRRRWFRYRLRTLLIVLTVLSLPLGWVGWRLAEVHRERSAITWVYKQGGQVGFIEMPGKRSRWEESKGMWFRRSVESVDLSDSKVSDLSPLTKLKQIKSLVLNNTSVSDLSPLAELQNLKELDLNNTPVSDLTPLAELRNLEWLDIGETQVSDLSPLAKLKNLKWLFIFNNTASYEQSQELEQALPNCQIVSLAIEIE
jgi:Leucine-rich repeat (LRR) protein